MTSALPVATVHVPALHLPALLSRLTTYLLEQNATFLQTLHDERRVDFDVFRQQVPLLRLAIHATDAPEAALAVVPPTSPPALAADAMAILHHLRPLPPAD